jgi:GNAT superfamily N-acetyltransferase
VIPHFESLAREVWPPAESESLDGWQLGFSDGCTKRANSVYAQGGEPGDLETRIERCEEVYRSRGLPVVFKLTPASRPEGLDMALEQRGYRVVDPTSVQLSRAATQPASPEALPRIETTLGEPFREACMRLNAVDAVMRQPLSEILRRIESRCEAVAFASIGEGPATRAQGIGVLQRGRACLCEIVTDPAYRRQGLAASIVGALCGWAREREAVPWLQVVAANGAAVSLYAGLGFEEAYRYWYRVSD